jgi:hypothetical protein
MKFGAAFGIGFGAGFVGTFTGGAVLTSVGASGISGGILAGIVSGAGGAAASSPISGLGNYAVFGDQYSAGDFVRDVVFGSALGGATSGVVTRITCPGCNIWTGRPQLSPTLPQTARVEIPERTYAPDLKTESALPASAPKSISNEELIKQAAQRANNNVQSTANAKLDGARKHVYAEKFIKKYQGIYGNRGLGTEIRYEYHMDGKIYRSRLDVLDLFNSKIYDYKFGNAIMSKAQLIKYIKMHPGYQIIIVNKFGQTIPTVTTVPR